MQFFETSTLRLQLMLFGFCVTNAADIVFKYRQTVTRSFQHLQGDYYIAPAFMEKVVTHIAKNYLASQIDAKVPLILGVWGGKGQGKSFQTELIFKALDIEPIIMSAGEMESEWAGPLVWQESQVNLSETATGQPI
jgi:hypothetical protein